VSSTGDTLTSTNDYLSEVYYKGVTDTEGVLSRAILSAQLSVVTPIKSVTHLFQSPP
jgi:hypothetical protein